MPEIDLSKIAVGSFANFDGMPVDFAKSQILNRAGVPLTLDGKLHPLREGLIYTHASSRGDEVALLPDPFPAADYDKPLSSAQDYLTLIEDYCNAQKALAREVITREGFTESEKIESAASETIPSEASIQPM